MVTPGSRAGPVGKAASPAKGHGVPVPGQGFRVTVDLEGQGTSTPLLEWSV